MPNVLITPAAENDLINLWIYIARSNPDAADRVYEAAEEAFETLSAMPGIGTPYRSKRYSLSDLRFFPITQFPNYVIYYQERTDGITIIRVLHGHMERHRHLKLKE